MKIMSLLIFGGISLIGCGAYASDAKTTDAECAATVKTIIDGYETGYSLNKTEENKGILDAAKKVQKFMQPCPAKEYLLSFSNQSIKAAQEKVSNSNGSDSTEEKRNEILIK